jgi:hypothetical protein
MSQPCLIKRGLAVILSHHTEQPGQQEQMIVDNLHIRVGSLQDTEVNRLLNGIANLKRIRICTKQEDYQMKHLLYVLPVVAMTTGVAYAQSRPGLPMADVASDLGLSETDLASCLEDHMPPRPTGDRSSTDHGGDRKGAARPSSQDDHEPDPELISCLQQHNSSITESMLDDVMQKYRPERPDR